MPDSKSKLAQKILDRTYGDFFYYPAHTNTVEKIWSTPGNPELLEEILNDSAIAVEAKFLSAEVLFAKSADFIYRIDKHNLAQIYANALVNNYTGMANSWGLLYKHDDSGSVGRHFVALGDSALPSLLNLLDNDKVMLTYVGSEEATVGNRYRFRIKDFAAFYISKILHRPVPFHQEYEARDIAIEQLKSMVLDQLGSK